MALDLNQTERRSERVREIDDTTRDSRWSCTLKLNQPKQERGLVKQVLRLSVALLVVGVLTEPVSAIPTVSAVKTDSDCISFRELPGVSDNAPCPGLVVDIDGDGEADPGDTLRYQVWVANSGSTNATNAFFRDILDFNTTLTGSVRTTPIARHDFYSVPIDLGMTVPVESGVLANDSDADGQMVTVSSADSISLNGGSVTMDADGSFTYDPPDGFAGIDSFDYQIEDADGNTDPANVLMTVSALASSTRSGPPAPSESEKVPLGAVSEIVMVLGLMNPGQVVLLTIEVTVNDPFPEGFSLVCNQGLFEGDNFSDVLTDDPTLGGVVDPTCTDIDLDDPPDLQLILGKGPGPGEVTLQWMTTQPPYEVFRSTDPASVHSPTYQLGTTTETEWIDTPPAEALHFYFVTTSCDPQCESGTN